MFSYYLCMPSSKAYKSGIKPLKNGKDSVVSSAYCYHYYSYYYHHKSNRTVFTPRDSIS